MKTENCNWKSEFTGTSNEIMTILFSKRVNVVTNFKLMTITALKDDRIVYSFDFDESYTLKEFEQFLLTMEKSAKDLNEFSYGNE